jgi:uncharacterized protein (DUF302 family)
MKPQIMEQLFERALTEELGLVIEVSNPKVFELDASKFSKGIARYEPIVVCTPSTPDTVMLVKRTVSLHNVEAPSN